MKHYIIGIACLLICTLLAFTASEQPSESSKIALDIFHGSNEWWLAIAVKNADVDTSAVQVKDSKPSSTWNSMEYADGWGYWVYASKSGEIEFPVSIRLTSEDGEELTSVDSVPSASVDTVFTNLQYATPVSDPVDPPAVAATRRPNKHTTTTTTTPAPRHTTTTTKKAATTTTTKKPSTTTTTTTKKPSTTTTTTTTTTQPSTGSGSGSAGCSAKLKLLVPLYSYPGAAWDTVAASGSTVGTVAVINPNSGPGTGGPDSSYTTYMTKLKNAGVEMVGYVHTSYGARAIADVKADIDQYAQHFPLLVGIFLDEASASSSQISYYTQLYQYIMGMPGWKYDILNPGAVPAAGYAAISTQIVSYESAASGFASSPNPSGVSCSNKNQYAVIVYSASSSSMQTVVNAAVSKGYYGWVYATDGTLTGNTYGTLPSYYASMASYIASH